MRKELEELEAYELRREESAAFSQNVICLHTVTCMCQDTPMCSVYMAWIIRTPFH